jgi:hypothetical protein
MDFHLLYNTKSLETSEPYLFPSAFDSNNLQVSLFISFFVLSLNQMRPDA